MPCREAMLAPVRPRSSWLRKLSLTLARSATSFSVWRRARRSRRSCVPTDSAAGTGVGVTSVID